MRGEGRRNPGKAHQNGNAFEQIGDRETAVEDAQRYGADGARIRNGGATDKRTRQRSANRIHDLLRIGAADEIDRRIGTQFVTRERGIIGKIHCDRALLASVIAPLPCHKKWPRCRAFVAWDRQVDPIARLKAINPPCGF